MTYDGVRFWVGPTTDEEIEQIVRAGGRKGQIYRDLRGLRDRYAELIRGRFPSIKRRVSGFNLDQLLPENGFNLARALVGTEGTCALILKACVELVNSPPHRVLLVLGFDDIYLAADAVPDYERFRPIAIEGLDRMIIRGLQARNLAQAEIDMLPQGDAWVVLEFGADTEIQASDQAEKALQRRSCRSIRMFPTRRSAGRTPLSIRIDSETTFVPSMHSWHGTGTERLCSAISATDVFTRASRSISDRRKGSRNTGASCGKLPNLSSRLAGPCRANTATDKPRASFFRSCSATNWWKRCASSSGFGTPTAC